MNELNNADVTPLTADPDADLVLEHTSGEGTTLDGSRKGDGVQAALRGTGVYWKATRDGLLYIPHSRDKAPNRRRIDQAATALRALGFTVRVEIDATPRDAARVREDRLDAAQRRANGLDRKAGTLNAQATALRAQADQISHRFEGGQPHLPGHHSYAKSMRDAERMHTKNFQAMDLEKESARAASGADAARTTAASLDNPVTLARRIDTLQTELRGIARQMTGHVRNHYDGHGQVYMQSVTKPATGEWRTQLQERQQHLQTELDHARELYAEHVRAGSAWAGKVSDIKPGDAVKTGKDWFRVVKVNPTTITVLAFGQEPKRKHFEIRDHKPATPAEGGRSES
ncbi:DUF3560 domain-containing protein [Lentzea terrae]|uniref:DUF3560 domain-containing protein n=1 Tax=Lentzea terrae TaxID=2200761 RepID=UPI000DD2E228|nr:DUF3560 domain-containing protein [Lentzea terrae]